MVQLNQEPLVSSKPGTQHVPMAEEFLKTQRCFTEFVSRYRLNMTDGVRLPPRNSSLQVDVMLDSSHLCANFEQLNICMDGRYRELVDFDCLANLTSSSTDAAFYLRQLSAAEFFCDFSVPFIDYSQCSNLIAEDVTEESYSQCTQIDWNSCRSVAESLSCRLSLIDTFCRSHAQTQAFVHIISRFRCG
ncbi:hypothetical protein OSTOST_17369 [Ostertagia ostertagi]